MNVIILAARSLAILLAIVSGFIFFPLMVPLLLALGGIAAINNNSEKNSRNYLITIVLILGAKTLQAIPFIGSYLATIFASLGIAFVGASIVAIVITLAYRMKRDWLT
jgi:cytochrome c biogenesis factor